MTGTRRRISTAGGGIEVWGIIFFGADWNLLLNQGRVIKEKQ